MKIITTDLTTVWKEKNTGPLVELSDFPLITNQGNVTSLYLYQI